jgi:hypothetical protein
MNAPARSSPPVSSARQSYTLEQIKDMLCDRMTDVAYQYAPPAKGAYEDKGLYFTLNPGRADRTVGSFCIHLSGPKVGRWNDYATGAFGDVIDLIALSLNLSLSDAFREARAFLGLQHESPELIRARAEAAARAKARRAAEERQQAEEALKSRKRAEALWLSAAPIAATPVELYLRRRAIDLRRLGHAPGALRYHRACTFHHEETDPDTGEVFTIRQQMPAMLASIVDGKGQIVACHRTYLAIGPDGHWTKARVLSPRTGDPLPAKKVMGDYRGAAIRLSSGIGPRGGKAARLAECPPGTRVYIAEGIETALSAVILKPEIRVLAAVSLSNMASVALPANVAEVVLITDGDTHPQAVAALDHAVQAHAKAGRLVRQWASATPGEDLNDALMRALTAEALPA